MTDLVGENACVELADEFGCVCRFHVLCLVGFVLFAPERQGPPVGQAASFVA
ncbi:hypothetical protein D3C80_2183510 [compost metagenome]